MWKSRWDRKEMAREQKEHYGGMVEGRKNPDVAKAFKRPVAQQSISVPEYLKTMRGRGCQWTSQS